MRELLGFHELGLELLAGEAGTGRRIASARRMRAGSNAAGQVVLVTARQLPPGAEAQAALVRDLAGVEAAALCVETGAPVQRDLLVKAQAASLPVLTIPSPEFFASVREIVDNFAGAGNDPGRDVRLYQEILNTMRDVATDEYSPRVLLERLSKLAGFNLFVVSPSGGRLLPGTPAPPQDLVAELASMEPHRVFLNDAYVQRVELQGRTAAFLLAVEAPDREPRGLQALRHVATVVAMMAGHLYNAREQRAREGAATLTALLAGSSTHEAAGERLDAAGFPPDAPVILAACRPRANACTDEELHHMLSDEEIPSLVLSEDQDILVLLPSSSEYLGRLIDAGFAVGVSRPVEELLELSSARREALWSMERAATTQAHEPVLFGQTDEFALWLPTDASTLRQLVAGVLGPILKYDEESGTELVPSLATFFRHQRKLAAAAEVLYVHKHTLSYRLRRVEELTRRDLSTMEDQVQFWLALKALAVVDPAAVTRDPRLFL